MKERAFNALPHEIRGILAGRQSQMRRVVKPQPPERPGLYCDRYNKSDRWGWWLPDNRMLEPRTFPCPYGAPGDRPWVRETWALAHPDYHNEAEGERLGRPTRDGRWCHYRATDGQVESGDREGASPWRPSTQMPRWASRITLELTAVRVERLQDISEADAVAEGATEWGHDHLDDWCKWSKRLDHSAKVATARGAFAGLWDSLNAKRAPWTSNPFVWVLSFQVVK